MTEVRTFGDDSLTIDGVQYVKASAVETDPEGWSIVRTEHAGCFAASSVRAAENGGFALTDARRLWYWDGAASLSELAMHGVANPDGCKFPRPVPQMAVYGVIEVIPMTAEAVASVCSVPVWSAR